eukprot:g20121.t1
MKKYVEEIRLPEMEKEAPEKVLDAGGLTKYRQLIMRLRWPAQQVMPHLLYEISRLAQRVSGATYGDFQDALKAHKLMVQEKDAGRAALKYPKIPGELCLVTFFDASLGKEKDGKSQLGQIHFITNTGVEHGPQPAAVIDFASSKSTRVVRSSMAAEAASMSQAIDRHLYARLLMQMLQSGSFKLSEDWRKDLTVQGYMVTDARSLYDHLGTTGQVPSERQTMLDLMVTREMLETGMFHLRWVPTYRQYADGLTKRMVNPLWTEFSTKGVLSLKETAEEASMEQHRRGLRRAQRERRKKRFEDGRAASTSKPPQLQELGVLAKEQLQMTSALDEMKQDYEHSKRDAQNGLQGIQAALEKLQSYYGYGLSLRQEMAVRSETESPKVPRPQRKPHPTSPWHR